MAQEIEGLKEILSKLKALPKELGDKKRRLILRQSAVIFKDAARRLVKVGKKSHKRYKDGKVIAEYSPGNLRESINTMTFRRARSAVFIGPRIKKGKFDASNLTLADGYYAHMVEFGHLVKGDKGKKKVEAQPFMRPAFENNKGLVKQDISRRVEKVVKDWIKKNTVSK